MEMPLSNLDHTLFRAYDIRGVVGEALIPEVAYHLGRAFAAEALANNLSQVTVAADGRLSSPSLKENLIKGLLHGGVDVQDIGYVPTPVLYFATYHTDSQTGIMITGSHNPATIMASKWSWPAIPWQKAKYKHSNIECCSKTTRKAMVHCHAQM